jgi:hypothetical protein
MKRVRNTRNVTMLPNRLIPVIVMAVGASQAWGREPAAAESRPDVQPGRVLGSLNKSHPRLILNDAGRASFRFLPSAGMT